MHVKCNIALACLLIASSHPVPAAATAENTNAPPVVSIAELLAHRDYWKGKRVEVHGFYIRSFELSELRASRDRPRGSRGKSLWIEPGSFGSELSGGYVRLIGTFTFKDIGSGHMNKWPAEITRVELAEKINPAEKTGLTEPR